LTRCRFERPPFPKPESKKPKIKTPMKINIHLIRAVLLLSTLNPQLSTVFAQGSLTPPGAPAPTMKSLAQIEPRTAITNAGAVTISQSGSYYLTTNITVSSGDAITITAGEATVSLAVNVYSASGRAFISWRGKLFWKANGSSGQQP
jgi:hypothetical protein